VAIHTKPDILLVDEVLAVGDWRFQQKCFRIMRKLKEKGTTIILVSHNLSQVAQICRRSVLLHQGKIVAEGKTPDVVDQYYKVFSKNRISMTSHENKLATIEKVELLNSNGNPSRNFRTGEIARCVLNASFHEDLKDIIFILGVQTPERLLVMATPSNNLGIEPQKFSKGETVQVEFQLSINLLKGNYRITTAIRNVALTERYDYIGNVVSFTVYEDYSHGGIADLTPSVRISKQDFPT